MSRRKPPTDRGRRWMLRELLGLLLTARRRGADPGQAVIDRAGRAVLGIDPEAVRTALPVALAELKRCGPRLFNEEGE